MLRTLPSEKIAVIGLGYVGLPIAAALAQKFAHVIGFDIKQKRIDELRAGRDSTGEVSSDVLRSCGLDYTCSIDDLTDCTFFIVAVPTPIDINRQPDLRPLVGASKTVAQVLKKGDVVVYESTVYPGVTEDICGPILSEISGMKAGIGFHLAYSPERINPGDKNHTFEKIVKVVSADTPDALDRVAAVYESVVDAGVYRAQNIKVAEAAKVIENTQRDVNIALMNELSIIFEKIGIRTADVLAAARTKWNFLPFTPGLVGGHCIGVDPYYLTTKAEELGYHPQVILSGRRINDGMGAFIAQKLVKMLLAANKPVRGAKIGILGLTFKENVPDLRNSRVPDILKELKEFGITAQVTDAMADIEEAREEYGVKLVPLDSFKDLDALILAVPHAAYLENKAEAVLSCLPSKGGVIVDVKAVLDPQSEAMKKHTLWSL